MKISQPEVQNMSLFLVAEYVVTELLFGLMMQTAMAYLSKELNMNDFDKQDRKALNNMLSCNREDVLDKPPPANIKNARADS